MTARLVPALEPLRPLLGRWNVTISAPELPQFRGHTVFEPIADGAFLAMRTVLDGNGPPDSYCVFGGDEDERFFQMLYSDERGISRVYACVFNGRRWEMWRRANGASQRFVGKVTDNGTKIDARWDASKDGVIWQLDFEMTFERDPQQAPDDGDEAGEDHA